ncbi:hypothetical protein O4H26_08590 [Aequorivita viscosa]|nr:hypothetical protein [Aequorivita viscosa]
MTLKELIQNYSWPSIYSKFLEIYPEAEKGLQGYKTVFEKLSNMKAEPIDMAIAITKEKDMIDGDYFIDVVGKYNNPTTPEEKYPQGIEFLPWRQWLGMNIDKNSLMNFSEQEIIVHCLYEMTFEGFNEDEIKFK